MPGYSRWNPDRNIRPVPDVMVLHGITLSHILAIDGKNIATLIMYERHEWYDPFSLAWNESHYQYPYPTSIRVDLEKIWHPDITLYNIIDTYEELFKVSAVVYSDGAVSRIVPVKWKIHCTVEDDVC